MSSRYARLMLDFTFRKAFGTPANKPLLLSLLNSFVGHRLHSPVDDVEFLQSVSVGNTVASRGAVFDLICKDQSGNRFLIEVQLEQQKYFADRALFYRSRAQSEMATKGREWDYRMPSLHILAFLDFQLDTSNHAVHEVMLMDTFTCKVFSDRQSFTFIEVPKFQKDITECLTQKERWIWMFQNLHKLNEMPKEFSKTMFETLFRIAEIANFQGEELEQYRSSMEFYDDTQKCIDYAKELASIAGREEGLKEGLEQGLEIGLAIAKEQNIRHLLNKGLDWTFIEDVTGVSEQQYPAIKELAAKRPLKE